jgi:hypothetical protein
MLEQRIGLGLDIDLVWVSDMLKVRGRLSLRDSV